jgi:asparagine synthase (glutamine-hydrolysing)
MADLRQSLESAVGERMVSDVDLGAFLSGGIDSSLITGVMQSLATHPVRTFSIAFRETSHDEANFAAKIAHHLGTQHTVLTATPHAALDLVEDLPGVFDEPFADPSALPALLLARLAREHVTVAMSGDGGDESFQGYNRYQVTERIYAMSRRVPDLVLRGTDLAPCALLDTALSVGARVLPSKFTANLSADRIKKLGTIARSGDFSDIYLRHVSLWGPEELPLTVWPSPEMRPDPLRARLCDRLGQTDRMAHFDTLTYLPDDILAKVDRTSMSVGLEVRSPLLDYRFIEAAWRAPASLRMSGGVNKIALRRMLDTFVPQHLYERPKQGFGFPVNEWLRGELKSWATDRLEEARSRRDELISVAKIEALWNEHQSGKRNWGARLWAVLMYWSWHERWHH